MRIQVSAIAAAFAASGVIAPSAATQEAPIVVLGEGLPASEGEPAYATIVLDQEQLRSAASGRIEDVLTNVAGFQQFRRSDSRSANPTAQGATLRALGGNATSRALVTLDGVPLIDPFFGYVPFSAIAPERLSRITLTRGGGSGPFGAGALAGVIAMESADADALGPFSAAAFLNDRGESELSASLAPRVGSGFAVVSGRWDRGQGFYTTPEDQRVPATARARFDGWSASGRLVQSLGDDWEIQLRGLAFHDGRTLRFAGADSTSEGEDLSLRVVSRGAWQVDALAYAQWRNFSNRVISSSRFTLVLDQKDTPSTGLGGKLEIRPPLGADHTLRLGADYRRSKGNLFEDAYSAFTGARREERFAGGTNSDFGLFAEHDWQAGLLTLTGGLRADHYVIEEGFYRALDNTGTVLSDERFARRADWHISWRGGALAALSDGLDLRAAVYRGLRLPTLNELYRPFVVFPVETRANAALEPERMEGWEAGIDWHSADGLALSATWFDNRVKGAISNVTLAENLRQRRNLDAIEAHGLELDARYDKGRWQWHGSLMLADSTLRGSGLASALSGNRPPQTPQVAASLAARYRLSGGAQLGLTLRHIGEQFESDLETDPLSAATTVDAIAQLPLGERFVLVARAENLLDERVVTRNSSGDLDLGAPRTIWLGLRFGY